MNLRSIALGAAVVAAALVCASPAVRADEQLPEIKIHDGRFEPANLTIAANTPIKLKVINAGDTAVEFESFELNRERVVQPGGVVTVYLPSLSPGDYKVFDDFHRDGCEGVLTAR